MLVISESQPPPEACGGECAVGVVVGDDVFVRCQVPARERGRERSVVWQRVAAEALQRDVGEICVEVRVERAGDVGGFAVALALRGIGEGEAAVDDEDVWILEVLRECFGRDERAGAGVGEMGIFGIWR